MPDRLTPPEIEFMQRLFNGEVVPLDSNTRVKVHRIRAKLESDEAIETRPNEGYILGPDENITRESILNIHLVNKVLK